MQRAALALLVLAGCGYQLAQGGRLPQGASALRVGAIGNHATAQAELGGLFAAALADELVARGQLTRADDAPSLEGELVSLRAAPAGLGAQGASAFRLSATLAVRLVGAGGAVLSQDTLSDGEDYLAGVDVLGTETNRRMAIRRVARRMAHDALEKLGVAGLF